MLSYSSVTTPGHSRARRFWCQHWLTVRAVGFTQRVVWAADKSPS